jgi:hypothetical protein
MRHILPLLLIVSAMAGEHLSPAERSVVGTWRQQNICGGSYFIFGPDGSYAYVAEAGIHFTRNTLSCSGMWRIEGDQLITDCTVPYPPDSEKARRGPERHVDRESLTEFFRGLERHETISYEMP